MSWKWIVWLPLPLLAVQLYRAASPARDGRTKFTVSSDSAPSATFRWRSSTMLAVERRTTNWFFFSVIGVGRWTNTRQRTHVACPDRAYTCTRQTDTTLFDRLTRGSLSPSPAGHITRSPQRRTFFPASNLRVSQSSSPDFALKYCPAVCIAFNFIAAYGIKCILNSIKNALDLPTLDEWKAELTLWLFIHCVPTFSTVTWKPVIRFW